MILTFLAEHVTCITYFSYFVLHNFPKKNKNGLASGEHTISKLENTFKLYVKKCIQMCQLNL